MLYFLPLWFNSFCLCLHVIVGHYLWGIDTSCSVLMTDDWLKSDITYEELIQSFDFLLYFSLSFNWLSVGHYLWGIDTFKQFFSNSFSIREKSDITYEELIRILAEYFHLTYPPSDITYEELIQSSTVYSEVNEASKYVGHYLWGIDTPFLTDLTSVGRKHVGHYLWGIDTYMHRLFLLRHGL